MQKKDASIMLKEEIGESTLRLKAAKFGHAIFHKPKASVSQQV
jgi:hypothetical protein